jgi:hypothetical protein
MVLLDRYSRMRFIFNFIIFKILKMYFWAASHLRITSAGGREVPGCNSTSGGFRACAGKIFEIFCTSGT